MELNTTSTDFTIDTSSLVDKVEKRILQLLIENKLKAGDSMPKELELASSLGVSRTVIREALMRLKVMGLVASKKKKGTIITSPDLVSILGKSMKPEILDETTLKEMFEMRLSLEIGMVDLIIKRVNAQHIKDLRNIIKVEKKYILASYPKHLQNTVFNAEYEALFHGKLYEITGNNTLKNFQKLLLPIFNFVLTHLLEERTETVDFVTHASLVDLIEDGNVDQLRLGMRRHLGSHFQSLI